MLRASTSADYRTRLAPEIDAISLAQWNALAGNGPGAVFVRHEWLGALERSGCVGERTGWQPLHLILEDPGGEIAGVVPLYAKGHSYGEYVFDWAWADAYRRHGLEYYPKLLSAVPFTPIAGPRLMARDDAARALLAQALIAQARSTGVSSLHVLFPLAAGQEALGEAGCLRRDGVQFHWINQGYADFEEFLAALAQPKRKKIRAERRKVAEAGVRCQRLVGAEISESDWAFFIRCYDNTYREHHSTPYLNLRFFLDVAQRMPDAFVMIRAEIDGRPIGASLLVRDADRLYGRYWGSLGFVSHMHFEVAYYQTIEAAIDLKIGTIEGGAQGEHKMARGFVPVRTTSAHWLAQPEFADAVERFLERESGAMSGYIDELEERKPFRSSA